MNRTQKIALAVCTLAVAGLVALAAPALASTTDRLSSWALFGPADQPEPTAADGPTPTSSVAAEDATANPLGEDDGYICVNDTCFPNDGPGDCTSNAAIHPYGAHDPRAQLGGELVDMGATDYASGEVGYNEDGLIETYTVAPGDSLMAIGERFCVDYVTVGAYNDRFGNKVIQPGDVLVLRP